MRELIIPSLLTLMAVSISACGEVAKLPFDATTGPLPQIVTPNPTLIPTLKIAPAVGWPAGAMPMASAGLTVNAYAIGLDHPRWLYVLPNGDVLVAETDAPPKPDDGKGIKGMVMKAVMKAAGSGLPSANRITLLRDTDGDGVADKQVVFLAGLNSPFGMALIGNDLYVANSNAILKFPYHDDDIATSTQGTKVADIPAGTINHHWTKNILASADGSKLYVTVGSNSNAAENGLDKEEGRARILELDLKSGQVRPYATGLRNPNGMGWQPQSGALWTTVNERDELGSDLVPDYMTSVKDGGFYGWPYSYYGQHIDTRVKPQRPDLVAQALVPDYALGAHTASLGLAFYSASLFPSHFAGGAFIGQHGSWNRQPRSGYKVVFVPFLNGQPAGPMEDILTGFVNSDGKAMGRPVGVAIDSKGALLVADDVGHAVWRVIPAR